MPRSVRLALALLALSAPALAGSFQDLRELHDSLGITAVHQAMRAQGVDPGTGLRIAVIDNGFSLRHKALSHLQTGDLVDSHDWYAGTSPAWDTLARNVHGSSCLGILASRWDSLPGVLPGAQWILHRTEVEDFEEAREEAWLAQAIDRAVDSGASVISISLGYRWYFTDGTIFPWSSYDGATRLSSQAVNRAAARGTLVVVAMGNDGDTLEGTPPIGAPADAPGALSVGALTEDGQACGFSSRGPSYDGRPKPELSTYGCPVPVVDARSDTATYAASGTSFATPLMAGLAGLVRQLHPEWTPAQVIEALRSTASLRESPDSKRGAGQPDLRPILSGKTSLTGIAPTGKSSPAWSLHNGQFLSPTALGALRLEVLSPSGRLLAVRETASLPAGTPLSLGPLPAGMLVVRLHTAASLQVRLFARP